jgi:hypothetical protein
MGFSETEIREMIIKLKKNDIDIMWSLETLRCHRLIFNGVQLWFTQREKDLIMEITPTLWEATVLANQ